MRDLFGEAGTMVGSFADYITWLEAQPESVRSLASEFGIGTTHCVKASVLYVIGHREDDVLIMSSHDPAEDAERALAARVYVCAELLRTARP